MTTRAAMKTRLARIAGGASLLLWVAVLVGGTYVKFFLPHRVTTNGCYFGDAMIYIVKCSDIPAAVLIGNFLTMSWYWTWGFFYFIILLPIFLPCVVLWGLTLWLAIRFVRAHRHTE